MEQASASIRSRRYPDSDWPSDLALGKAGTGLAFAVTGSAAIYADGNARNQRTLLLFTAPIIVAAILLLVYRSPVLWLLPLFGAIGLGPVGAVSISVMVMVSSAWPPAGRSGWPPTLCRSVAPCAGGCRYIPDPVLSRC
jgi:predicted RND superfamily exporter protein